MPHENPYKKLADLFGITPVSNTSVAFTNSEMTVDDRRLLFRLNESYYHNTIYNRLADGGGLDFINDGLGDNRALDLSGMYNPVERIVEAYAMNVFAGNFGEDYGLADMMSDGRQPFGRIPEYLTKIAQWSNFDQELANYVRMGAMLGTVGIRVCTKVGPDYPNDPVEDRRVWLEFEHPSKIIDAVLDGRQNVKSIITEFTEQEGDLTLDDQKEEGVVTYTVRELMTKTKFERSRRTKDGKWSLISFVVGDEKRENIQNALGVTPYVLVRHKRTNGLFGSWCFSGSEPKIDKINALTSHIDRQIIRHVKANWAVGASGKAPVNMNMNGNYVMWFELSEGAPTPFIEPMVAPLSIAESLNQIRMYLDELSDSQPELRINDSKWLSGQSGETIAQLRLPAEKRILTARGIYEDGLIRAVKIAFSFGIMLGIFDFGVDASREGADIAFRKGLLDFAFNKRNALPLSEKEALELDRMRIDNETAEAEKDSIVSPEEIYTE